MSFIPDPPGPPEISGYLDRETIRQGQTVTLVCTAAGGNPLAKTTWFRNGVQVDTSYTTSGRESRNTLTFIASTEDNQAKYRCESINDLSAEPKKAEIVLSVQCKLRIIESFSSTEKTSFLCQEEEETIIPPPSVNEPIREKEVVTPPILDQTKEKEEIIYMSSHVHVRVQR